MGRVPDPGPARRPLRVEAHGPSVRRRQAEGTAMSGSPADAPRLAEGVASGRYRIHFQGRECGEERWRIERAPGGLVATGEQETMPPHPFPSRQAYRATLTAEWRLTGLEILWS